MAKEITRDFMARWLKDGGLMVLSKLPDMEEILDSYEVIRVTPDPEDDTRKLLIKIAIAMGLKLPRSREIGARMMASWVSKKLEVKEKNGVVFIVESAHRLTKKGLASIRRMREAWGLREDNAFLPTELPSFIMLGDVGFIYSNLYLQKDTESMLLRTHFPEFDTYYCLIAQINDSTAKLRPFDLALPPNEGFGCWVVSCYESLYGFFQLFCAFETGSAQGFPGHDAKPDLYLV